MMLLPNLGAVLTVVLGFLGLLFPKAVGRVLGIDLDRPLGTSEFRATYGGFFLSLGIGIIVAQSVQVFTIVGAAWCSAAIVRMVSCAVDNVWTSSNLAGVGIEAGIGYPVKSPTLSLEKLRKRIQDWAAGYKLRLQSLFSDQSVNQMARDLGYDYREKYSW